MNHKFRNLVMSALVAVGLTSAGTVAVSALASAGHSPRIAGAVGQTGTDQTGESVNENKDDAQQGQAGVEQTGESVNDNKDDAQQGQAGTQQTGESVNDNQDTGTAAK